MSKTTKEEALAKVEAAFGFVPNLMAGIADTNPAVATAYLCAAAALEGGVLSPAEKHIVMLAVSSFNECHYCTAAHRTAGKAMGVSQADLDAIDDRVLPSDPRNRALAEATWTILSDRGWVNDARLALLGVSRTEAFEIIAIIGLKTISNYVNHTQGTEIDAPFRAQAKRAARKAA
jgi:AhpD family alkylhydroperoxidase